METIVVFNTAADGGGALTILENMYEYAKNANGIKWFFLVSTDKLEKKDNIDVLIYKKSKSNWLFRIFYDLFFIPRKIKKINPKIVLNLQNIYVRTKCKQIIYLHQPIPFIQEKIKISDGKLWIYKNIISKLIYCSIRKCYKVIVQTNWMKNSIIKLNLCNDDKIIVLPPKNTKFVNCKYKNSYNNMYFYPAAAIKYKDHITILKAFKQIKNSNYQLFFTLTGNENKYANKIKKYAIENSINVVWLGSIDSNSMSEYYENCILIFSSYIETYGLPLLEAKTCGCPIITADTPWAREILKEYRNVKYFTKKDENSLKERVEEWMY